MRQIIPFPISLGEEALSPRDARPEWPNDGQLLDAYSQTVADDDPALMQRYNIRGVPALLFFQGGELRDQIVGVAAKKAIVDKLETLSPNTASA